MGPIWTELKDLSKLLFFTKLFSKNRCPRGQHNTKQTRRSVALLRQFFLILRNKNQIWKGTVRKMRICEVTENASLPINQANYGKCVSARVHSPYRDTYVYAD